MSEYSVCQCPCGATQLPLKRAPLSRFRCHCLVCQHVYNKPFGSPTVLWHHDLGEVNRDQIVFTVQRRFPFRIDCGTCASCQAPVLGFSRILPFLSLAYIPESMYSDCEQLPPVAGHLFYEHRVNDVEDALPKCSGLLASEWGVARFVLRGVLLRLLNV